VTHPSPVCRHATHRETACHFGLGFIRSSLWRINGAPVELRDSPTPNLVDSCVSAGYVLDAKRIRVVDYPRLHPPRGTRMAHINVGPTKAVGVGPTARREREVEAMHQAIRSGQISTKYPNGAVVTIFDPPPPDFDPLTADPTQLWRHGFPPRPSDPAALRQWGALLGTPLRFVTPTITRRPAPRRRLPEFYGHESTDIWSGAVVFASTPATLFTVTGQWKVPHIKPFSNGDDRYVGVWVGIDGDRSGDVLQAGIAAEMSSGDDQPDLWAWFEWFPDDSNEIDVPVAVGDSMSCVVTADQDCLPRSAVQHGQWKTIDDDHTLVPMHDGKILDWGARRRHLAAMALRPNEGEHPDRRGVPRAMELRRRRPRAGADDRRQRHRLGARRRHLAAVEVRPDQHTGLPARHRSIRRQLDLTRRRPHPGAHA
jgi:hypothetical protein